ncbi:MAG TPA: metallophosphoesterase family protein [Kofleriaceae bacterium]|jgi:hypothetical protein
MRSLLITVGCVASLAACVKGNPFDVPDLKGRTYEGGSLDIDGCGYSVTTRPGAEAPQVPKTDVGPAPDVRAVHLGFVGDPETSMVAQWRTLDDLTEAGIVRYAEGADLAEGALTETGFVDTFSFRATGSKTFQMHQGHMCNLKPGKEYSYQVGSDGHFSPVYTFHTAPDIVANPDATVVLGDLGDSRDGYEIWGQLVEQLSARTPDMILFSGDAVTVGLTQLEWEVFFDKAEPLFARVPVISAHGNHEVNAVNYYSQFAMPGDQETFGFDYGYAHITVANDTPDDVSSLTGKFADAIEADMAAHDSARWKLFMHHQPIWSASTRHGSSTTLLNAWGPIIDRHDIDLVLNGHDHDYEISKPMKGSVVQANNSLGTVFVVMGGAGAELYGNGADFWTETSEMTYAGSIISVSRDTLQLDAFRQDGSPITCNTCAYPTGFKKTKN